MFGYCMFSQVAVNPTVRKKVFQHHLQKNPGAQQYQPSYNLMTPVDANGRWDNMKKRIWRFWLPSVSYNHHVFLLTLSLRASV
jgi:hypothetical protein